MMNIPRVGDRVLYHTEEAVVCYEDPLIARTLAFHSYVWLRDLTNIKVIEEQHFPGESIRQEVVERIRRYIDQVSETPTGCT